MSVKDVYSPQYSQTNYGDQLGDFWEGKNLVAQKDMLNSLEQMKATALNKYEWNKQGMLAAGINPLMNPSALGSADAASSSASPRGTPGQKLLSKVASKGLGILGKTMKSKKDAQEAVKVIL